MEEDKMYSMMSQLFLSFFIFVCEKVLPNVDVEYAVTTYTILSVCVFTC